MSDMLKLGQPANSEVLRLPEAVPDFGGSKCLKLETRFVTPFHPIRRLEVYLVGKAMAELFFLLPHTVLSLTT